MKTMSKKITRISLLFCCISTVQMFAGVYPSGTRLWDIVNNMFASTSFSGSTISAQGSYTLTNNIMQPFAVNSSGVTIDLNGQTIFGLVTVNGDNVTLKNGIIVAPAPIDQLTSAAALTVNTNNGGIFLTGLTVYTSGANVMSPGRDGIDIIGTSSLTTQNIQIVNCLVTGEEGNFAIGGNALSITNASNIVVSTCVLTAGDGGDDPINGHDGGDGIVLNATNNSNINESIINGGNGGNGGTNGGMGGQAIDLINSSNATISNNPKVLGGDGGVGSSTNGGNGGNGIFAHDYSTNFIIFNNASINGGNAGESMSMSSSTTGGSSIYISSLALGGQINGNSLVYGTLGTVPGSAIFDGTGSTLTVKNIANCGNAQIRCTNLEIIYPNLSPIYSQSPVGMVSAFTNAYTTT